MVAYSPTDDAIEKVMQLKNQFHKKLQKIIDDSKGRVIMLEISTAGLACSKMNIKFWEGPMENLRLTTMDPWTSGILHIYKLIQ